MPELPEVETIKNELAPQVVGRCVIGVSLFWRDAVREPSPAEIRQRLIGQRIESIRRRGKYLLLQLSDGETLILHLKMSGVLLIKPTSQKLENHTTAIFHLDGGGDLHFIDQRKFGSMWLVKDENTVVGKLGPEPLDASFTLAILRKISSQHRIPIKVLLCDQHAIAGIGNMYADEALFAARIQPLKKANALSDDEIERLHAAIIEVLERGIKSKGASTDTYRRPDGKTGSAHTEFNVAHRNGEACPDCGSPIQRVSLRGRGVYFCPNCQRDEPQPRLL